ncbi:hypothetical protein AVEN_163140-1 [Araneus ventricosus]|uniref:Uncharacterized protein n=1 Tax=Araneus ventricosus TaxID=182803 RepID=A0A4Y2DJS7_ARAVE|nr:hypothetical protein AVEN_163140-1 [Araneus ventricosus]
MYFQPAYNDNHFLNLPAYKDNFTFFRKLVLYNPDPTTTALENNKLWSKMSENRGIGGRNQRLLYQEIRFGARIGICTDVSLPPIPAGHKVVYLHLALQTDHFSLKFAFDELSP